MSYGSTAKRAFWLFIAPLCDAVPAIEHDAVSKISEIDAFVLRKRGRISRAYQQNT